MLNGQQQEPYEGRSSRTVLWERRGEVPLRDPITPDPIRELADWFAAHAGAVIAPVKSPGTLTEEKCWRRREIDPRC